MTHVPDTGQMTVDGKLRFMVPASCLKLPEWTKHVTDEARLKFQEKAVCRLQDAWIKYRGAETKEFWDFHSCGLDGCGSLMDPGYPLASMEELIVHLREVHGVDDARIARSVHAWETRSLLTVDPFETSVAGELLTSRDSRKRSGGPVETIDNIKFTKKSRR